MSCILPSPGTTYVSTPNIRGTLDIITTSLGVIVLSTWNVLHVSVPLPTRPNTKRQSLTRWLIHAAAKASWMLTAIAAPEYLVARGMVQRARARRACKELDKLADVDGVPWSLAHTFFADMRGFEVVFSDAITQPGHYLGSIKQQKRRAGQVQRHIALLGAGFAKDALDLDQSDRQLCESDVSCRVDTCDPEYYNVHASSKVMLARSTTASSSGDIELLSKRSNSQDRTDAKPWYNALTSAGIDRLSLAVCRYQREAKLLGTIMWGPDPGNFEAVSEAEQIAQHIRLSYEERECVAQNLFAFIGSSWRLNAAQLIKARSTGIISELPYLSDRDLDDRGSSDSFLKAITLLQIMWQLVNIGARLKERLPVAPLEILALALAACAMVTSVCLWHKPQDADSTIRIQADRRASPWEVIDLSISGDVPGESPLTHGPIGQLFYDGNISPYGPDRIHFVSGVLLGSTIFGAFHFISWNHKFPSLFEQDLWHISAIASLVAPWIAAGSYALMYGRDLPFVDRLPQRSFARGCLVSLKNLCVVSFQTFYIVVRLFVAVECVRSLFFLEPGAFQTTWTVDLPHIR